MADYNEALPQPSTCLTNNSTCLTVQQRRPLQTFAGIEIAFGAGDSVYHALQAKLEHRYASGLYLLNSFTWSHAIDNASGTLENNNGDTNFLTYTNPNYDRGRSGYDQPLNDTTSVIYDLPSDAHSALATLQIALCRAFWELAIYRNSHRDQRSSHQSHLLGGRI